MAGRPYTMREMRQIVDYLKETNAYGEIKGRKMWMDYEQAKKTSRTWQSMKETFLKRILPDIHNPYYKLTSEEIASFRVGYSMIKSKHSNKLEVKVNKNDPKSLGNSKKKINTNNDNINVNKSDKAEQKSKIRKDNEIKNTDENKKCLKITSKHEHPIEPIVLNNNFYESSQDIINDLLSSNEEDCNEGENNIKLPSPNNTKICHQKDFISYSEPLLPILKQIVQDFDSDNTDCSPELDKTGKGGNKNNNHNVTPIVKKSIERNVSTINKNTNEKIKKDNNEDSEKLKRKTSIEESKKINTRSSKSKDLDIKDNSHISLKKSKTDSAKRASSVISSSNEKVTQSTCDNSLPNNQEGLLRQESKRLRSVSSDKNPLNIKDIEPTTANEKDAGNDDESSKKSDVDNKKISHIQDKEAYDAEDKPLSMLRGNSRKDNSKDEKKDGKNKLTSDNINSENCTKTNQGENANDHEKVNDNTHKDENNRVLEINKHQFDSSKCSNNNKLDEQLSLNLHLVDRNNKETAAKKFNVLLQSNSSDSSTSDAEIMPRKGNQLDKNQALSKLFGFSNGGSRSCALNNKITHSHLSRQQRRGKVLELSDWTSDNDSDFIPPPHNRKSRKRYLKPDEARIMNLDNDGGTLVTYKNKVYPVITHGHHAECNFLKMMNPNDGDNDGLFWKKKYIKERKRYMDLTRLVNDSTNKNRKIHSPVENETFVISDEEDSTHKGLSAQEDVATTQNDVNKYDRTNNNKVDGKATVTIKNIQTYQEITLEGKWPDIEPIFNRVLKVLPQDPPIGIDAETDKGDKRKSIENVAASDNASTSGNCNGTSGVTKPTIQVTPPSPIENVNNADEQILDQEVKKKIDEVENAIFKEIEEIDKSMNDERVDLTTVNIKSVKSKVNTRKRGRPTKKKSALWSGSDNSGSKRDSDSEIIVNEKRLRLVEDNATADTQEKRNKTSKTSTKSEDVNVVEDVNKIPATDSAAHLSEDESELRYKFPSPEPTVSKSKETIKKHDKSREVKLRASKAKLTQTVRRNVKKYLKNYNSSFDSTENMHDYQDSDGSPITLPMRRNKLSLPTNSQQRRKSRNRKRSLPNIYILANNNSDNEPPLKQAVTQKSISNSKSDEDCYIIGPERLHMLKSLSPASQSMEVHNDELELDNTGSVSIPASPALSIVQNISFSKQALDCMEECATLSNTVTSSANSDDNVQHMSIVSQEFDVTNPLMNQQFNLIETSHKSQSQQKYSQTPPESYKGELTTRNVTNISDIILVNDTVNNTPSEMLNKKMCNMIIDSAKKLNHNEHNYATENKKKILAHTCSTPHRKRKTIKSKALAVDGVIDECMEYCTRNKTRSSCPPSIINFVEQPEQKNRETSDEDIHKNVGRRKKRAIIKVKILRPSNKKKTDSSSKVQKNLDTITLSDSYVNDSEHSFNDSVDMIHNHSDTCINVNECYQDTTCASVECDSEATTVNLSPPICTMSELSNKPTVNLHNSDSPDAVAVKQELTDVGSPNSLITEDLSYEVLSESPPSGWCLLSEDENSDEALHSSKRNVNSQYMEQLFPVVCAVPDLSTITEASRDVPSRPDNSNKKVAGTTNINVDDTRDCFYSCTSQDTQT